MIGLIGWQKHVKLFFFFHVKSLSLSPTVTTVWQKHVKSLSPSDLDNVIARAAQAAAADAEGMMHASDDGVAG